MRVVVLTSAADALGAVLARAYHAAGGPPPAAVVVLPDRAELGWPMWVRPYAALRMLGVRGTARMAAAASPLAGAFPRDRAEHLGRPWVPSLARGATPVLHLSELKSDASAAAVQALAPDLLLSLGAPVIIPKRILELAPLGTLNVHNGRLPAYRGHFGTFWEVCAGEQWGYVSIHRMIAQVDAGPLVAWDRVDLSSCPSFLDALMAKKRLGGRLLADLLNRLTDGTWPAPPPEPAESGPARYYPFPRWSDLARFHWPPVAAEGAPRTGDRRSTPVRRSG